MLGFLRYVFNCSLLNKCLYETVQLEFVVNGRCGFGCFAFSHVFSFFQDTRLSNDPSMIPQLLMIICPKKIKQSVFSA